MCRAAGRRCPSDHTPTREQRDARNARRRARYAEHKAGIFTVATMDGDHTVRTDRIDDVSRYAYMNGQCFSLAVGLADRIPGARVGVIVRDDGDVPWGVDYSNPDDDFLLRYDDGWFGNAVHAVVVLPDGEALDIDGPREMLALEEEMVDIHDATMVVMDADDLRAVLSRGHVDPPQNFPAGERMAATVGDVYLGNGDDRVVEPVVFEFLSSRFGAGLEGLPELPPEQLRGLCEQANGAFAAWLESEGEPDVRLVDFVSMDDSPVGAGYPHTVCVVGDEVVDLTYGQIEPGADVPTVVPLWQWESQWRSLQDRSGADVLADWDDENSLFL